MKFLEVTKDGGPESTVWAHWLVEIKGAFSVVLLRFEDGSRDAYHSHAFNSISWVLGPGYLREIIPAEDVDGRRLTFYINYRRSWRPVWTYRSTHHKVVSRGRTWVLSFRGPWSDRWTETLADGTSRTLTHGRREVSE